MSKRPAFFPIVFALGATILAPAAHAQPIPINGDGGMEQDKWDNKAKGRPIKVSVTASTFSGHTLHYHWRATDGRIDDVDASTTHWRLPGGPGIHFAYVLIEDGMGGFAESRIAVNTDQSASTLQRTDQPHPIGQACHDVVDAAGFQHAEVGFVAGRFSEIAMLVHEIPELGRNGGTAQHGDVMSDEIV
jgi:hypothetical protein